MSNEHGNISMSPGQNIQDKFKVRRDSTKRCKMICPRAAQKMIHTYKQGWCMTGVVLLHLIAREVAEAKVFGDF